MRISCPACNRDNDNETTCRRCGADLTAHYAIKENALYHIYEGRRWLCQGQGDRALSFAQSSWGLLHSCDAARLAFLACLLLGRFDEATHWYRLEAMDSRNGLRYNS